jgi:hypothetical protein
MRTPIDLDETVQEITEQHFSPPNLLCSKGNIRDAMQLYIGEGGQFLPLSLNPRAKNGGDYLISGLEDIFIKGRSAKADYEYRVLDINFNSGDMPKRNTPSNLPLSLSNKPEDVRFRQEAVREIVRNPQIYRFLGELFDSLELYTTYRGADLGVLVNPKLEKTAEFIHQLRQLGRFNLGESLRRCYEWSQQLSEDTLFKELLREKRESREARVIALYTERGRVRYALMKPGVNPEQVFEFLQPELTEVERTTRSGKEIKKPIVKYRTRRGENNVILSVELAKQDMDYLNERTFEIFAESALLTYLQMKHLFSGADLHKRMSRRGFPVTFPEIADEPGKLAFEGLLPIRLVRYEFEPRREKSQLCPNSMSFNSKDLVVEIAGPNRRGKSEFCRTLHLFNAWANAGYAVPAKSALQGYISGSHFISFKASQHHGGSDLEHNLTDLYSQLGNVPPGHQVIIDDLGDSTNAPTTIEIAKVLIPALTKRGNRVFITSQHDSLSGIVLKEMGGIVLMPNPKGKGSSRYKLVQRTDPSVQIDFESEGVLRDLGFSPQRLIDVLPKESCSFVRPMSKQRDTPKQREDELDDIPF